MWDVVYCLMLPENDTFFVWDHRECLGVTGVVFFVNVCCLTSTEAAVAILRVTLPSLIMHVIQVLDEHVI